MVKNTFLRRFGAMLVAFGVFCSLLFPAFAEGGDPAPQVSVEKISLDKTELTLEKSESTPGQLTVTVTPENATDKTVEWSSNRPTVADVDQTGKVTVYGVGKAVITVRSKSDSTKYAICTVTVTQKAEKITLLPDASLNDFTLRDGGAGSLIAELAPSDSTDEVSWESSDENVIIVTNNGSSKRVIVKAVGPGTATITAKTPSGAEATYEIRVTAIPVGGIALDHEKLEVEISKSETLTATISPPDASNKEVEWKSDKPAVATVDDKGKVTGVAEGEATITATITDQVEGETTPRSYTATCKVTVKDPTGGDPIPPAVTIAKVEVEPVEIEELIIGQTAELKATAYDENGEKIEDVSFEWISKNDKAATVDANSGVVTAVSKGTAVITAIAGSKSGDCRVTVVEAARPIEGLTFSPDKIQFVAKDAPAQELKPNVIISPTAADRQPLEWSGGDDTIAKLDTATGTVTPVAPGETVVKVAAKDNSSIYDECTVIVSGIRLSLGSDSDRKPLPEHEIVIHKTESLTASYFGAASNGGIQWSSSDNAVVSVSSGRITARAIGTATITVSRGGYTAECKVTVTENTVGVIKDEAEVGKPYDFSDILSKLNRICQESTPSKSSLSYIINLSVPPEQGVLYYNYVSPEDTGLGVGNTEKYYYSETVQGERHISGLTFVPNPEFSGTATIRYTGFGAGRESYSGTIVLEVEGVDDVTYSTILNTPVTFKTADFNTICKVRTGRELNYVTFTLPQPKQGTLYFNYAPGSLYVEKVASATKYYRDRTPSVGEISFLPADDYSGTVTISYRATDTSGASFNGEVTIRVNSRNSAGTGDVNYLANQGEPVTFQTADFNSVCRTAVNETLDYVRFTLPASSAGVLYYNYQGNGNYGSAVKADDRYYRSGSPSIDAVTFVPTSGSSSPVTIQFSGYGSRGTRFEGSIVIQYTETSSGNTVTYTIRSGRYVRFDVADFNELCQSVTGGTLNYVQFDLPPASLGRLYYGYDATRDNYADVVSSSANYYRTGRNLLIDNVSFVAAMGCTGTVEIPFTGRSSGSREFSGMVRIQVLSPTPEPLRYTTISAPVSLTAADFQRVCGRLLTGELSYVQFNSLPATSAGVMYSGYTALGTGTQAAPGIVYYAAGSPSLDQLCFVPRAGFTGTVSFDYTAQDVNGGWVHGTGEIVVTNSGSSYFVDLGNHVWAAPAADFLFQTDVAKGISPGRFGPGHQIKRGDFVLMLCRAFRFNTGSKTSFPDVSSDKYYADAVATAKDLGITNGSNGYFLPEQPLTRQDAMVMVRRAMQAAGWNLTAADHSYLSGFADGAYIAMYARDAVAYMVQMGVVNGNAGLLNPKEQITRAEMAVILHRVLTL